LTIMPRHAQIDAASQALLAFERSLAHEAALS
jgi:hypothetical protein